jgi:type I restriction enzyme S subunit
MVESEMGMVPEGWRVGTIGEIAEIKGGSTPDTTNSLYWENGQNPFCTPKDLSTLNSPILLDTERHITNEGVHSISSKQLPAGTLLLSSRAPVGYLAISSIPISVNQGFIAMICDEYISNVYLIQWLRENMDIIEGRANGSTFQEISKRNFRTIPFLIPSIDVLTQYNSVVKPLYNQITTLTKEMTSLSGLRDTLLSKMMTGDIIGGKNAAVI